MTDFKRSTYDPETIHLHGGQAPDPTTGSRATKLLLMFFMTQSMRKGYLL